MTFYILSFIHLFEIMSKLLQNKYFQLQSLATYVKMERGYPQPLLLFKMCIIDSWISEQNKKRHDAVKHRLTPNQLLINFATIITHNLRVVQSILRTWSLYYFVSKFEEKEFSIMKLKNGQALIRAQKIIGKGEKNNRNTGGTTSA